MINVSVYKHGTENSTSLIRRFTKRMQGSGVIKRVKGARYTERKKSPLKRRVSALRRITKKEKLETMERMGLIKEVVRGPRRA